MLPLKGLMLRRDFSRHTVTFRVTTREKAKELQLPRDRPIRMRIVGEEISGPDPRGAVVA
jgi:hypothetical protein